MKGRFNSKQQAMQMAIHCWTCEHCGMQHKKHKPTTCKNCGIGAFFHFDSVGEANKFAELRMLQDHGQLSDLRLQVPFPVYPGAPGKLSIEKLGKPVFKYIADFVYRDNQGRQMVVDYKGNTGHVTDLFKLKKKIIEVMYQVEIRLV